MNERIRQLAELAEQADEYAKQTVHYYMGQFDGLTWEGKIKQTRDTKFAELIVKECLAQVDKVDTMLDDDKEKTGVAWVGLAIAKHFGVEE